MTLLKSLSVASLLLGSAASNYTGTPFFDDRVTGPQTIPGQVWLSYYDFGGPEVAYHVTDLPLGNQGSCRLNDCECGPNYTNCTGKYKNVFRYDEGVSTSYTKDLNNSGFCCDRFVEPDGSTKQMPLDWLYVGWSNVSNWYRVTVDVLLAGEYTGSLMCTSDLGGTVSLDVDFNEQKTGALKIPSTAYWHNWTYIPELFKVHLTRGKHVLTYHIESNGDGSTGGNFNTAWIDFQMSPRIIV